MAPGPGAWDAGLQLWLSGLWRGRLRVAVGEEVGEAGSRWAEVLARVPVGGTTATNEGDWHPAWAAVSLAFERSPPLP